MNGWRKDKDWSDGVTATVKSILGLYLIGEAREDEDQERNTDFMVLKIEAVRIACRIRRPSYSHGEYLGEFTMRCLRPSGCKTELTKVIEGWGDYFFYGFAGEDGASVPVYTLADLNIFRLWHSRYLIKNQGRCPGFVLPNKDGSGSFTVFKWVNMPDEMIVAQKGVPCVKKETDSSGKT